VTELRDVEIGTGSGFVVSAGGYIVTNHHAVADGTLEVERKGQRARIRLDVRDIEVLFPSELAGAGRPQRFSATIVASDETVDLALLYVTASGLSVAALGDSDAVVSGEPVRRSGIRSVTCWRLHERSEPRRRR
jgi:S1-C subfamily serine protease